MRRDHPLVLLCYFGTVLVLSMLTMHPLWIGTADRKSTRLNSSHPK